MLRFLFGIIFSLYSTLSFADDGAIWLTFYDKANTKIADVWLELPSSYPDKLIPEKAYRGQWRGVAIPSYVNPHPGWASAGMKLNKAAWQELDFYSHSYKQEGQLKKQLLLYLHPRQFIEDGIILIPINHKRLSNGEWRYQTDGGRVDSGTYKVH